jgi:hypothetical protein
MKVLVTLAAAWALGAVAAQAALPAPDRQVSAQAKAAFIKKCFRDRTKQACDAPPQARLPK